MWLKSRLQDVATRKGASFEDMGAVFDEQLSDGITSPMGACEEREFITQVEEAGTNVREYARRRQKKMNAVNKKS